MAKEWAKAFYNSKKWKRCKESYKAERIKIDGGFCEVCHEKIGYIVHHKVTLTPENINNPDIALNHNLLSYECKDCHDEHEGHGIREKGAGLLVLFDGDGQPIPKPPRKNNSDILS